MQCAIYCWAIFPNISHFSLSLRFFLGRFYFCILLRGTLTLHLFYHTQNVIRFSISIQPTNGAHKHHLHLSGLFILIFRLTFAAFKYLKSHIENNKIFICYDITTYREVTRTSLPPNSTVISALILPKVSSNLRWYILWIHATLYDCNWHFQWCACCW